MDYQLIATTTFGIEAVTAKELRQLGYEDLKLENGKVYDDERIVYYQKHINSVKRAVEHDGVDLLGYLAWSPIDFLSSHKEIRKRYGFVYVNRDFDDLLDLKRYKKKSFYWYQKVIKTNGEDLKNDIEY